jgi:hypothetical protein
VLSGLSLPASAVRAIEHFFHLVILAHVVPLNDRDQALI